MRHMSTISLKAVFLLVWFVCLTASVPFAAGEEEAWKALSFLEGTWIGKGDGMSGTSSVKLECTYILNSKFLRMKAEARFAPQEKNPKGEFHEDLGFLSYDSARKTIVLRAFYVEGFVNQYILVERRDGGNTFIFDTESVENAPPGTKARLIYKWDGKDTLEESFFVAFSGQELSCMTTNTLTRSK